MAFQAVPDCAEIVITYQGHGKQFKNVVHASKLGGYDLGDLVALASAVDVAVSANWLPIQSVDYAYVSSTARGLALENDQEWVNTTGAGAGVKSSAALPDNVTLSIKKSSGLTGRTARGRLYWIGTALEDLATNESMYTLTATDAIVDAVNDVRIAITASVWTAAIVSRFLDNVKRTTGVFFEWKDCVAVDGDVDSQRRRLL